MLRTKLLEAWASFRNNDYCYNSRFVFTYWYSDDVDSEDRCDSNPDVLWDVVSKFCKDKFITLTGDVPTSIVIAEFCKKD